MAGPKQTKVLPSTTLALDAETGVMDAYVSITGIMDDDRPPDVIELGAFRKSIAERGPGGAGRIRVLWQHCGWDVIGLPLQLQEHGRDQLPETVLARFPSATGGLFAKTRIVTDVQRGREALALYKAGAMSEWSIGFDSVNDAMETLDGMAVRRIMELRLWEYSPVTWGANPGTTTTNVKSLDEVEGITALRHLGAKLNLPATLTLGALVMEIEKRLRQPGAEPPKALTPAQVEALKGRVQAAQSRTRR